jgi:hypothetical protein
MVVAPARLLLQRTVRGYFAWKRVRWEQAKRRAATVIARFCRGKSCRLWRQKVKLAMRHRLLQRKVQAAGRGFIARRWHEIAYRHAYFAQVVLHRGRGSMKKGWLLTDFL